jgi:hypothetical protein
VKDRRGRGFFRSMVSILDILSGAVPLMVDVRQSGGSPLDCRHRLARPSAAEALFVFHVRPPLPGCFPTTASEPIEGRTVDSSPVDHRTRKSDPVRPVTTPSREASPTFLEGICTRSPTTAIRRMLTRRCVSGQRGPTPVGHRRSWRLFTCRACGVERWTLGGYGP